VVCWYRRQLCAQIAQINRQNLLLVKMKEKNLLKIQPLPKVLRMQATARYKNHFGTTCKVYPAKEFPKDGELDPKSAFSMVEGVGRANCIITFP
jgi:hypothetical protein